MRLFPFSATLLSVGLLACALSTAVLPASAQSDPPPPTEKKEAGKKPGKKRTRPVAHVETAKGTIVIELYPEDAPNTVDNFVTLAKKGFYDGLTFHRVEPGFVVQGGDPKGDGTGGPGYTIKSETNKKLSHVRGAVAMANGGRDTAGSQFYIVIDKPAPQLDNVGYTLFGLVVSGQDVAEKLKVGDKMTRVVIEEPEGGMPKIGPTRGAEPEYTFPPLVPAGAGEFNSRVRVKVTIEPNGSVRPELLRKSGDKAVDEAILEALRAWKWKPALKNGDPVRSSQQFDYDLRTDSRSYE